MKKNFQVTFDWEIAKDKSFPANTILRMDRDCEITIQKNDILYEKITISKNVEEDRIAEVAFRLGRFIESLRK